MSHAFKLDSYTPCAHIYRVYDTQATCANFFAFGNHKKPKNLSEGKFPSPAQGVGCVCLERGVYVWVCWHFITKVYMTMQPFRPLLSVAQRVSVLVCVWLAVFVIFISFKNWFQNCFA